MFDIGSNMDNSWARQGSWGDDVGTSSKAIYLPQTGYCRGRSRSGQTLRAHWRNAAGMMPSPMDRRATMRPASASTGRGMT
jgi:hypothetical protein